MHGGPYFGRPSRLGLLIEVDMRSIGDPRRGWLTVVAREPPDYELAAREGELDPELIVKIAELVPREPAQCYPGENVTADGYDLLEIETEIFDDDTKTRRWSHQMTQPWGGTAPHGRDLGQIVELVRRIVDAAGAGAEALDWLLRRGR
jgi:hypothetical protein